MNTEKIIKEAKIITVIGFVAGILLLGIGIVFSIMGVDFIANNKSIIGLSLLPFSVALLYFFKIVKIKKTPDQMKNIIISESDERLVALKNEADAKALKIVRSVIFLCYMGYTLMVPEDIFEAVGWWILMVILFVTFTSQAIFTVHAMKKSNADDKEV